MKAKVQNAWRSRQWLACLFWPLSQLYGVLVWSRARLYKNGWLASGHPGVSTLVIGNVVAGGAGKTPLVMALLVHLKNRKLKVGVISRGYGRTGSACREVFADSSPDDTGDEPALIKSRHQVPVFVGQNRLRAAHALLKAYPDTELLICDDGLQHYALKRDLEIVVFDDGGTGNGWLLPAGPLREPWPRPTDLLLHTGLEPAFAGYRSTRRLANYALAADGSQIALESLTSLPLVALAGIANPQAFFEMLEQAGLHFKSQIALNDHHDFRTKLPAIEAGSTVLCTEKDAIKIFALPPADNLRYLSVALVFEPEAAFFQAFDHLLDKQLAV